MSNEEICAWIDSLPLSKKRKNLARDFADGCLMAEVIHVFYPKLVDLHNYDQGLKVDTKIYNWNTLNQKVLKKLQIPIDQQMIVGIANAKPGFIEKFLEVVKIAMTTKKPPKNANSPKNQPKETNNENSYADLPMTDKDRELLIEKIIEADQQTQLIHALEMKTKKLMELMRIKDAKIMRLMQRKERMYK